MTIPTIIKPILIGLLLSGCHSRNESGVHKANKHFADTAATMVPVHAPLKVSAYLVYDDGSMSSFDVLNDKSKALWNTIIGEGDAEKPSSRTKIRLTGVLDSLTLKIMNGEKTAIDQPITNPGNVYEQTLENTGCAIVKVYVRKRSRTVFEDSIAYHCGE